jgi:hypothetical protein
METTNPIIELLAEQEHVRKNKESYRYPYRIVCVFLDEENNDFPIILEVRDYCNKNNVVFTARAYDYEKHSNDMFIHRLPAFHLYYKRGYCETFHYDENPVYKLQRNVWDYEDKQRAKERSRIHRKEQWDTFVQSMKSIFTSKKKPPIDLDASLSHKS